VDTQRVSNGGIAVESGLRIRVDSKLRKDFIGACKARDTTAAQVLRSFMRDFVDRAKSESLQGKLFEALPTVKGKRS